MHSLSRRSVIIDTDPGIDDALAILLALASSELDVIGLTTVFGNASVADTTRNALSILEQAGSSVSVFPGASAPLRRPLKPFPVQVHGKDGLGDVGLADPVKGTEDLPAEAFLVETVRSRPGEVSIIALGPLTNIAAALDLDPLFAADVKEVVLMGGAFFSGGNITPVAEANIYSDPGAADAVFAADLALTAIGLDVTANVIMEEAALQRIAQSREGKNGWIHKMTGVYLEFERSIGVDGIKMHDPAAVTYFVRPDLFETVKAPIAVVPSGLAEGQTIATLDWHIDRLSPWKDRPRHRIAVGVDAAGVLGLVEERLCRGF